MLTSLCYNHIFVTKNQQLSDITQFLTHCQLKLDPRITDMIEVRIDGKIIACGGVDSNIIKCVAINPEYRGQGIVLRLVSELLSIITRRGQKQVFLYTKPENITLFSPCGFYPLVSYQDKITLMENSSSHLTEYCQKLALTRKSGDKIGCIVMNANPFTLGHQYLIEQAVSECDWLHIFLVKEDQSQFCYHDRFTLVKNGIANIGRVTLHGGSEYIISKISFPNYFIKNEQDVFDGFTAIDLTLFRHYIAPSLGINRRFVGHEPIDVVTRQYNLDMCYYLHDKPDSMPSIDVIEIPRKMFANEVISASRVRELLKTSDFESIKNLVPNSTFNYLVNQYANKSKDI